MGMNRRGFLTRAMGAAAAALTPGTGSAELFRREARQMPPKALGMLYDSTLCIGCRACVTACKEANGMPVEQPADLSGWNFGTWDTAEDISGKTLNVIRVYQNGTKEHKDQEENGYAFIKRHCLHCVDPSCISVCPVSAMQKDPETGIVTHDPDACIGCRYCVYGCPFGVPQYQLDNPFGEIAKCQFCKHLQAKGEIPACCDVCPTGASLFGTVADLEQEARRRLDGTPGEAYEFPRGLLGDDRPTHEASLAQYQPHLYGEKDGGGTQVRYLSAIPHEKLGLPKLPDESYAQVSEGMQHTLYKGMVAPVLLLGGLVALAHRSTRKDDEEH